MLEDVLHVPMNALSYECIPSGATIRGASVFWTIWECFLWRMQVGKELIKTSHHKKLLELWCSNSAATVLQCSVALCIAQSFPLTWLLIIQTR